MLHEVRYEAVELLIALRDRRTFHHFCRHRSLIDQRVDIADVLAALPTLWLVKERLLWFDRLRLHGHSLIGFFIVSWIFEKFHGKRTS